MTNEAEDGVLAILKWIRRDVEKLEAMAIVGASSDRGAMAVNQVAENIRSLLSDIKKERINHANKGDN